VTIGKRDDILGLAIRLFVRPNPFYFHSGRPCSIRVLLKKSGKIPEKTQKKLRTTTERKCVIVLA
jgi:hypothetical protein